MKREGYSYGIDDSSFHYSCDDSQLIFLCHAGSHLKGVSINTAAFLQVT